MIKNLLESVVQGWTEEYRFCPDRKWRFDYANVEKKIAVEIEGGVWKQGRHNRSIGFVNDMEKYNMAQILGWRVMRYTPQQLAQMLDDVSRLV